MAMQVELARQQWEEGHRRLRDRPGGRVPAPMLEQVEAVTEALRRRVGGLFTLAELAQVYEGADVWAREAIADRCPRPGWIRSAATAADAAFYLYSRGARDYRP